tara:strand:- start:3109 stop:4269 length:1161 start_codon:yes stop_codon:yes gene_type:complete
MHVKKIIFFGGSRWTKILIKEIISSKNFDFKVIIISPSNFKTIRNWIKIEGLMNLVQVNRSLSLKDGSIYFASIVSNSTKDHFDSVLFSLNNNIPVLVEKPVTEKLFQTEKLVEVSRNKKIFLGAAHVYFFSKNMSKISKDIDKRYETLEIIWSDPINEIRHSEQKFYDFSIPIFTEYLPHVLSILKIITKNDIYKINACKIFNGGSFIKLIMTSKKKTVNLILKRNANKRERFIKAYYKKNTIIYDFSETMPSVKSHGKVKKINFDQNDKPAKKMITSFFSQIIMKKYNRKLDIKFALRVNKVIDDVRVIYEEAQLKKLNNIIKGKNIKKQYLAYMVKEIVAGKNIVNKNYDYHTDLIINNILDLRKNTEKIFLKNLYEIKKYIY